MMAPGCGRKRRYDYSVLTCILVQRAGSVALGYLTECSALAHQHKFKGLHPKSSKYKHTDTAGTTVNYLLSDETMDLLRPQRGKIPHSNYLC